MKSKNLSSIYRINPFFSWIPKENNRVIASLYGKIKVLKCIPSVLEEVLNLIDGKQMLIDIVNVLSKKYHTEEVQYFLNTIIEAEFIVDGYNFIEIGIFPKVKEVNQDIVVMGQGILANAICKKMEANSFKYRTVKLSDSFIEYEKMIIHKLELLKNFENDFLIACPDKCTYGWLVALNNACLKFNIPFILCYYNGKGVLLGPMVVPKKTPCYSCLLEHKRRFMSEKSGFKLTVKDFFPLIAAWPLKLNPSVDSIIDWIATYIAWETATFIKRTKFFPRLLKKQIRVPTQVTHQFSEITFGAITTCPSCFGMNQQKTTFGFSRRQNLLQAETNKIVLKDTPVKYQQAGYRSVSAERAKKMVDEALKNVPAKVTIKKVKCGALDDILHRFTATIENRYENDFPFLISDLKTSGKGITGEQAYLSSAFEFFERISARYYGDTELVQANYSEVKEWAIDVPTIIGKTFHNGVIDSFKKKMLIDWVWGYSLVSQKLRLVPASLVFMEKNTFLGDFGATSGGLAAGAVIEDAILQALLEVVEHDAWMIWQANAITMPKIRNETIHAPYLTKIIKEIEKKGFRVIIRSYITDISTPIFRAWIVDEDNYLHYATHGFGACLNPELALERAISEAYQPMNITYTEEQLNYDMPKWADLLNARNSLYSLYYFNQIELLKNNPTLDYGIFTNQSTGSVNGDIRKIIEFIQRAMPNGDVIVVNLTRDEFKIPTVRVIVEGLQRISEPLISVQKRLFELPQKLGYREDKLTYRELYSGKYPH